MRRLNSILWGVACLYSAPAHAAGAYLVDDGNIVDPGNVQIESWVSHSDRDQTIGVADIAYQLLPNAEFTILNSYDTEEGHGELLTGQIKYQWLRSEDAGVTSAAVVGSGRDFNAQRFGTVYVYVPTTFPVNEWLDTNLDLGWDYVPEEHLNFFTWGVSAELHVTKKFSFVQEIFGNNDVTLSPGTQSGLHYEFSKAVQGDIIYGRAITGTPSNWLTLGVVFTF